MSEPTAPPYTLLLFTKENCAPCRVAKPYVEKAAATLNLPLEELDVFSEKGEKLILPLNIMSVPTLIVLRHGKKWQEFSGGKDLTEKLLVDRLTRLIEKDKAS